MYADLLLKWSRAVNLVSPATLAEARKRHFEDSLQLLPLIPEGAHVLFDLGSGAGFPGLVLAISRPEIEVHLFESDQKKCSFLGTVSRETDTPVIIHTQRIETVDKKEGVVPDVITARALASLEKLLELTEGWWERNPQLVLVFPKGARAEEELAAARKIYQFDVEMVQSQTEKEAKILVLRCVKKTGNNP